MSAKPGGCERGGGAVGWKFIGDGVDVSDFTSRFVGDVYAAADAGSIVRGMRNTIVRSSHAANYHARALVFLKDFHTSIMSRLH